MKYSEDTKKQTEELFNSMRIKGVQAFQYENFGLTERYLINRMVKLAKYYARIQEHHCNGTAYKGLESRETNLENSISEIASRFGLKVDFTGDPRGYCVKLHAPKGDVWNTLGGKETGYGIG